MTTEKLSIDTLRCLAMDAVEKAASGHPGTPMALAPAAYVLFRHHLRHDPASPGWVNRDRFVLSCGHASMLLYGILHLSGYDLPLDELKKFRQWGSKTPGHPEVHLTPGVETTTGPLGQGFANGVGMAIAERYLAARFNRPDHEIIDHRVFAFVSDGDLMEGVASEAASLAGHLQLGKLVYLYDDNRITIEGKTDLAFSEDVGRRFEAYGWQVLRVDDANDTAALGNAFAAGCAESARPTLIICRSHIAYPAPHKQDTAEAHGAPLGADEIRATKKILGWPEDSSFHVPAEVAAEREEFLSRGKRLRAECEQRFAAYRKAHPDLARELEGFLSGALPAGWDADLPRFEAKTSVATRKASGKVLNTIAKRVPQLLGGSADLAPSNNTLLDGEQDFTAEAAGRNMHFGIREHAMGSIANGMMLHGGVRPYVATFLIFSDYARPAIRLAGLMHLPVIWVFTHDSIGLGEDGPTHQPVETFSVLRAIPNLVTLRPGDANESVAAWQVAMARSTGPTALAFTRQNLPVLEGAVTGAATGVARGAYVLEDSERPEVILIGTGSEVHLAVNAKAKLAAQGVRARVVSMPSWELFLQQDDAYRRSVLPPEITARVAVEAGIEHGWSRFLGDRGRFVGMTGFGASAPYEVLYREFGITTESVVAEALAALGR